MISETMKVLAGNNSAIRAMFEEGNRLAALYGRENVYDFSLGNPNIPAPETVKAAILDILETEESTFVHGYMSNAGYEDVRQAVAEYLNRCHGTDYGAGNIIMTVGAAGGLNDILKTLLNPGDEVLTFMPYFLEYGNYVANHGGVLRQVAVESGTFQPDPEALRAAVTERTQALIVNNPNNPTGAVYTRAALEAVAAVLTEKEKEYGHPIYILSDEPYRELVYDGAEVVWLPEIYHNAIVGYSWSKSLSLPGERIGYLCIPSQCDDFELVYTAATIANRILGSVNAPSLMQRAVMRCLGQTSDISAYDRNRKLLYGGLTELGFEAVYPDGAFYLWLKVPDGDDKAFCEKAKKYNILMVPGSSFAGSGYVRLAYCVSEDTIRRSLPAFAKLAADCGLAGAL